MQQIMASTIEECDEDVEFYFVDAPFALFPTDHIHGYDVSDPETTSAIEPNCSEPRMCPSYSATPRGWFDISFRNWDINLKRRDASLLFLLDVLREHKFEAVFGFSQGAAIAEQVAELLEHPEFYPSFFADFQFLPDPLRYVVVVSGYIVRGECWSWETCPTIESLQDPTLFIKTPALHIIGRTDVIVVRERSEIVINFSKNSRVEEHPGGHFIPTRPRWRQFFAEFFRNPFGQIASPSVHSVDADVHTGYLPREFSLHIGRTLHAPTPYLNLDEDSSGPSTPDSEYMDSPETPVDDVPLLSFGDTSKKIDAGFGEAPVVLQDGCNTILPTASSTLMPHQGGLTFCKQLNRLQAPTLSAPKLEHAGRLIILDLGDLSAAQGVGRILSATPDGKDIHVLASGISTLPDGVVVDTRPGKGQIYITYMGHSTAANDGHIMRAAGDWTGAEMIVPDGVTWTPKQLVIDTKGERLYWADREGMRVMRCKLDGSDVETLVCNGDTDEERKDGTRHCVGVSVDTARGLLYWSQKGASKGQQGRILRANIDLPPNQTPTSRTDIQMLYAHLPEPIDLELDTASQTLYWTDRGNPPLGNTLNRADVSAPLNPGAAGKGPSRDTVVAAKFHEAIGLSLDLPGRRAFVSDLNGSVYAVDLESGRKEVLIEDAGIVTGIVYCEA
ncbi:YWTD domain-containing protein [Athelia psychrophila]|uniref:YWTD domain-containing protein n=1 Tax=Athelia psychrophila TaxID=1759441 RepID=A0A166A1M3_9AGAM|nr:YWTD domain-containing protein [Fibularhizoctonia sp. CBS 109695]